jgi:sialidase-1
VTWSRSQIIGPGVDEHHIVQRSDTTWLSNARPTGTVKNRRFSTASTISGAWSGPTSQTSLPDPQCNGDILRADPTGVTWPASWLLVSGCASTAGRQSLTVWLSEDNGATWPHSWRLYPTGAAYSSMVQLSDSTFGIFWEDTDTSAMLFTKFSLYNPGF